jgi:Mn-dependent DtxR family transcriptional regulator
MWDCSTLDISDLSRTEVAYIESMYRLNESHDPASVSLLAKRFGVRLPTAIEILDKLEQKGLVIRKPWKIPELSRKGKTLAESVMHQHRIVELYFSRSLGLDSETSCSEASKIAYLLDRTVVEKMCKSLNRPAQCVHGRPIRHRD